MTCKVKKKVKKKVNSRSTGDLLKEIEELKADLDNCVCDASGQDCCECEDKDGQIEGLENKIENLEDQLKDVEEERDDLDEQVVVLKDEQGEGMKDAMDDIAEIAGRFG